MKNVVHYTGLSQLDPKESGNIGIRTMVYFFCTSVLAVIVGIICVLAIHPGSRPIKDEEEIGTDDEHPRRDLGTMDAAIDIIRQVIFRVFRDELVLHPWSYLLHPPPLLQPLQCPLSPNP